MLKKKNKYSPYLSVYKPQLGNMISILERISGIILIIVLLLGLVLFQFSDYFLMDYNFYNYFFIIFKGNNLIIKILIIFVLLNYLYHTLFIPIIIMRLKKLKGTIEDYRYVSYSILLRNFFIKITILIISLISVYLYII
jgi:succinate dehydrogenase/fumarate reductase cytochrome b subunit